MAQQSERLPRWFYVARAVTLLAVGVLMVVHETIWDDDAVRVLVIVAALLLMGFSAPDLRAIWSRGSGA